MSEVAVAFLSASLQVLFDRLASREVMNLFSKPKNNVGGLLKELKRKLLLLEVVLEDADVKQFTNKKVKVWSDEAREAVYQADDLLSEIAYEAKRCKLEADPESQSTTSQVKSLILSSFTSFDEHIESKLKEIIQLLKDLVKEARFLGLKKGDRRVNMPWRSSSSVVVESDVYGRDLEKEELISLLLSDATSSTNNEVGVIPVVGMGGLGKTTLAQLAYNDGRVGNLFEVKAWACVSEEFDALKVTKTILESVTKRTCESINLNHVQESLKEQLKGKKFLLVLDDVWNDSYERWDILRTPLRTGASGSKIIVTSRSQKVADIMKTGQVLNLTELSDDTCWSLFAKIAFNERDPSSYPVLEEIGRKIVKRCRGLPLAVKSLAGLLRSKLGVDEWEDVRKSEIWDLTSDILPALRLSYHYLPSHLKQCFAFCSLFPKNYEFMEEEIVSLWIAQKFVLSPGSKNHTMEGKKCFQELLSVSFFQHSKRYLYFVMHDLIHDLAQVVSGQFYVRLDNEKLEAIPRNARHLSFCVGRKSGVSFETLQSAEDGLWTFLPIPRIHGLLPRDCHYVLSRQKQLRVLSLQRCMINELPDLIGSLIHLHYLDLSLSRMMKLPESICKLYNLETLLLVMCEYLTTLPVEIGKLVSLRRLDITGTKLKEMPMQMGSLKGQWIKN